MHQDDVSDYIAKFYGSWFQDGHYHFLIEYVGGGTLTDFLQRTQPPMREEEILKFWTKLLDLIKIIGRIREMPISGNESQYLQG
jgi:serine/threonine protein kinase